MNGLVSFWHTFLTIELPDGFSLCEQMHGILEQEDLMSIFLKTLLSMSLAGSILLLALLALRPLLRKRTTRVFQYALWLLVLLRLLLPLSLGFGLLPRAFEAVPGPEAEVTAAANSETNETNTVVSVPTTETGLTSPSLPPDGDTQTKDNILPGAVSPITAEETPGKAAGAAVPPADGPAASVISPSGLAGRLSARVAVLFAGLSRVATLTFWTLSRTLSALWAAGVCASLLRLFVGYRRLNLALKTSAYPANPWEKALLSKLTDKPVALSRSSVCMTPMLMGLRHPAIVLPDQEYDESRLTDILLHELTHQRRCDLLYKWLTAVVCAIHWFNPLMPLLQREINRACELACDEAVIRNMDLPDRMRYGETLLSVASDVRHPVGAISATMCEEKRTMRERLSAIGSHGGKTRRMVAIAAVALVVVLVFAAALGVFTPEKSADGSEWLAELCGAEVRDKAQSELLGRFEAYLKDNSSDFTSEDITKRYDRAELTDDSGAGSITLFYQDPMGLTVADRLSYDKTDMRVQRGRSTVEDTESSLSSREIHVIHDAGYAYGYYVVTLEKWPSDGGTASNIRVYDAKKQRARILVSTDKEFEDVVWNVQNSTSAAVTFTVSTADGMETTFLFDPATMMTKTAGGISVAGKGALDMAEMEALQEEATTPFRDLRGGICGIPVQTLAEDEYDPAQIMTFTFNAGTIFTGHEAEAAAILEAGKNPGLGVRALHDEGVTGKGVNVAIIDQNLLLDHPEFAERSLPITIPAAASRRPAALCMLRLSPVSWWAKASASRPGQRSTMPLRRPGRATVPIMPKACAGSFSRTSTCRRGKRSAWCLCPPLHRGKVHFLQLTEINGMQRWPRRRRQASWCWIAEVHRQGLFKLVTMIPPGRRM